MSLSRSSLEPWASLTRPDAPAFVVGLPHAGAGGAEFRRLRIHLPEAELVPIVLPGREHRAQERPARSLDQLVSAIHEGLTPLFEQRHPVLLAGVSFGALLAFALAQRMREAGQPAPLALVLASRRPPHLPDPLPPLGDLTEPAFIDGVQSRYGTLPESLLHDPTAREAMLRPLRADIALLDRVPLTDAPPLTSPLLIVRGDRDATFTEAEAQAWSGHSQAGIALATLQSGHFVHRDAPMPFAKLLSACLHTAA